MSQDMISHICSHGTTSSRAKKIKELGFLKGHGRAGKGIYFWKESPFFIYLAVGWYKYMVGEYDKYSKDKDRTCSVLVAELQAKQDEILDLENDKLKEMITDLYCKFRIDFNDRNQISLLYELFIEEIEKELGTVFKILVIKTAPPKIDYCENYPLPVIGAPQCCVARNTDCIKLIGEEKWKIS